LSVLSIVSAVLIARGIVRADSADDRLAAFDGAAARVATLEANPHFRREVLFGAARNLVSVADRWATIRPQLEQSINSAASLTNVSTDFSTAPEIAKPISKISLGASRYSGFTQSETATAWCGTSVTVGFNDTGSEIRTLLGTGSVSELG